MPDRNRRSSYGNDFARKGIDQQQYAESGLAETKSFEQFQTDRRAEQQQRITDIEKGGGYYKKGPGGKDYLARDPSVDQKEWNKNYYATLGIEDDGHNRGDGNPGSWGQEAHDQAVRAANQGVSISMEDRRVAWGNEADYDQSYVKNDGGSSQADRDAADAASQLKQMEAKERAQNYKLDLGEKEEKKRYDYVGNSKASTDWLKSSNNMPSM